MMSDDEEANSGSIDHGVPITSTPTKSAERPTMPFSPLGVGKSLSNEQASSGGIDHAVPTTSTPTKSAERPTMPYSPLGVGKSLSNEQKSTQRSAQKLLTRARKRKMSLPAPGTPSPLKYPKKIRRQWNDEEEKALVQFVAMPSELWNSMTTKTPWPAMKAPHAYWDAAAEHINQQTGFPIRTGSSVSTRVSKRFHADYPGGVNEAESAFGLSVDSYMSGPSQPSSQHTSCPPVLPVPATPTSNETAHISLFDSISTPSLPRTPAPLTADSCSKEETVNKVDALKKEVEALNPQELLQLTDHLYKRVALNVGWECIDDFASLSSKAMDRLKEAHKPNIMYNFAKILATDKDGADEPLLPFDRMPFGLIEHQINFFSSISGKVNMPKDFREWQIMMEVEFGRRFNQLFRGPFWSGVKEEKSETAKVNVACVSHETICGDIRKKSGVTTTPDIQVKALRQLKSQQADGRYWIKIDGTDIKPALQDSKGSNEWNGDVDKRDGKLEKIREEYDARMGMLETLTKEACQNTLSAIEKDKEFLDKKLKQASKDYQNEIKKASNKKAKELNWNILECAQLLDRAEGCINICKKAITMPLEGLKATMMSQMDMMKVYVKDLFKKKRSVATHVLVILASDEQRKRKPYSTPLQYIPYHTMTAANINDLVAEVKKAMDKEGLPCIGVVTDGEFNTLRLQGQTRPLHLYQVIQNARKTVATLKKKPLLEMIVKTGEKEDGSPIVAQPDAVPDQVIEQLHQLQTTGEKLSLREALTVIRAGLVPDGYTPATWRPDAPETTVEILKSIITTYRYRRDLDEYERNGVDFRHWLYVPEEDPITGDTIHAREDHNHLVKRIASHTRDGSFHRIDTRCFVEASKDPDAHLGKGALMGERKQSVPDAEALLSYHVARAMEKKGFSAEAEYVHTIAAWHDASDGRGMSQQERCRANQAMKAYILREWMPWCNTDSPDYTTMDINVRADKLCGFSRQTVIGVTANIESQEHRRLQNDLLGCVEHPRAGNTDDNELFFSLLHWKSRGKHPTLRDFKGYWQKLVLEFGYKIDEDLPFYFNTSNERYSKEDKPSFDEPGKGPSRLKAPPKRRRREDMSSIVPGRASLPSKHAASIRQQVHRPEVGIPAPTEEMQASVDSILNRYSQSGV